MSGSSISWAILVGIRVAAAQSSVYHEDGDYMLSLSRAGFDTLEARREQLTERFFTECSPRDVVLALSAPV